MRYKKALSSDSASGLLQTLVGKPVLRPNRLAKEFDETMRKAFKEHLAKSSEPQSEDDRMQFLADGLMKLAKVVSAPKNVDFESKHVRGQGGRFGSKPKANETSDKAEGPDLTDPKQAKKAWEDRVALGESREDFQALKQELYELGAKWSTDDIVASKEWFDSSLAAVEKRIENSVARAQVNEYNAHLAKFDSSPDKVATYTDFIHQAAKYDLDNSNVGFTPDTQKQYEEVVKPTRAMYRKLSEQMVAKGVAEDPTFPRFVLEQYVAPHEVEEKVVAYNNAVKQLNFKGLDLEAQEFIVRTTKETMEEFDSYDPYRDLTDGEVEKAWDTSLKLLDYYKNNGPQISGNLISDPAFKDNLLGNDWDRVLQALARLSTYTIGDWFGLQAGWAVQGMDRYVEDQKIPDVIMRLSLGKEEAWQKKTLFFGKALEHHRDIYGEDELFNAGKAHYVSADQMVSKLISEPNAYADPANQKPFLDFFTAMRPIVRSYVADMLRDDLTSQGPEKRRETFQTAFEGTWQESTLANIAKNSGNNLEGAETILRTAQPEEQHAIMEQVKNSWDTKEHGSFTIEPSGVFVVDRFAKHEVGFKQWAENKDHVGEFYHGTSHAAAPLILSAGFRVPKSSSQVKTGSMFGNGIYLAPNASKSAQYGDTNFSRGEGSGVLVGVKASMGVTRDVTLSGDYAPKEHGLGEVAKRYGEALSADQYNQIKDKLQVPIMLANYGDYVYAGFHNVQMADRPFVAMWKVMDGKMIPMGERPISGAGRGALMTNDEALPLALAELKNLDPTLAANPIDFEDDYLAYGKGSTTPMPVGPKAFIFGDRLPEQALGDVPPQMLQQVKLVITSLADTGVPGYDGKVYFVGKGVAGQWFVSSYKKTNKDRLIFDDLKIVPPNAERDMVMQKVGAAAKMQMLQFIKEVYPDTPDLGHLWNALDLDQIGVSEAGYDSVRGLSSANGGTLKNDEYVVFDEAQVVPDYVISYTRRRKDDD